MKPSTIEKIDLKKDLKPLYSGKAGVVQTVTPGSHQFLTYDGFGDPNTSPKYKASVEVLFALSYHVKFSLRKILGIDYGVMPLEGLWWSDDARAFSTDEKHQWKWTMMIMQPSFVTNEHVEEAKAAVAKKRYRRQSRGILRALGTGVRSDPPRRFLC